MGSILSECNRLWREYAFATNADIKLDGQMKLPRCDMIAD